MPSNRLILGVPADLASDKTIPPLAKSLYLTIRLHGPCSVYRLASESTISRESVRKLLGLLVQTGWVAVRGRANRKEVIATSPERTQQALAQRLKDIRAMMAYAGQGLTYSWLDAIVDSDEFSDNARPWLLQNPSTGEYLEYDRFYYKHGVAYEFNGSQHYRTTERFSDPSKVTETRLRDEVKARLSREHNVVLVTVFEEDLTLEGMLAKVPDGLPKAHIIPDSLYIRTLEDVCGEYIAACRRARVREELRSQRQADEKR